MLLSVNRRAKVAGTSFGLFCLALFLTAFSARNPSVARVGSAAALQIIAPFQILNSGLRSALSSLWNGYVDLINAREESYKLEERLRALQAENAQLLEHASENKRLTALLEITKQSGLAGVGATVIGRDPSNWVQTVIIDKGSSNNLAVNMPVVEGNGVVGQIIATSPNTSQSLLITDSASGVDAIIQRSRARGVVEGMGSQRCRLSFVQREEDIKIGDTVITSGMDGVFPKGLLLGVVSNIRNEKNALFQDVELAPSVNFAKLENVLVVTSRVSN